MLKPLVAFNGNHFIGYHKRPGVTVTIGVSDFQGKLKIRNYNYESLKLIANDNNIKSKNFAKYLPVQKSLNLFLSLICPLNS